MEGPAARIVRDVAPGSSQGLRVEGSQLRRRDGLGTAHVTLVE